MNTVIRKRLVPRPAIIAGCIILLVVAVSGGAGLLVKNSRRVPVPDVAGRGVDSARQTLSLSGLKLRISGKIVSSHVEAGSVVSQDPRAGEKMVVGGAVSVLVSAGPQGSAVPDLVGTPVAEARSALEALGFKVTTMTVSSDATTQVVLEMFPSPGTMATAGETVRLSVPGDTGAGDLLLPYDLKTLSVLIDPVPMQRGSATDATLEVARRLDALLEAAGATVSMTRGSESATATTSSRRSMVAASRASLLVVLTVGSGGGAGLQVGYWDSTEASPGVSPGDTARSITSSAEFAGLAVRQPSRTADPVLRAFRGTAVSVVMGDAKSRSDVRSFGDPTWADRAARAVYRGIGTAWQPN